MSLYTCSTVVGVFDEQSDADEAIIDLGKAGFSSEQIGVVARNPEGKAVARNRGDSETHAGNGAVTGAVAGAGIGGLVGLGVLAGIIPVIGPAIAAGTLGVILSNAAGGATLAGLGGALMGWGVPEEHAKYYDGQLQSGRVVVTVHAEDDCDKARTIMESHGGYNHDSVTKSTART